MPSQPIAIWITPCNWRSVKVAGTCTLRHTIGLSPDSQTLNCIIVPDISDAEAGDEPVRFGKGASCAALSFMLSAETEIVSHPAPHFVMLSMMTRWASVQNPF